MAPRWSGSRSTRPGTPIRNSTRGCSRSAGSWARADERARLDSRAGVSRVRRGSGRAAAAAVARTARRPIHRGRAPLGGDDLGSRRQRSARPAAHAAPRAGPLDRAGGASSGSPNGPSRARLLQGRLRPVPAPRSSGRRRAAPRVGALPIGAGPRGRARGAGSGCRAGRALVSAARSAATALAGTRPGARHPPRARRSLVGVWSLQAAGRRAEPAARPTRSTARAPCPDDGRLRVGQIATVAARRSRVRAAASARRRTLSALLG